MCSLLMQHGLVYTAISTQSSRYTLVRLTCVKASARARAGREELATRLNKNYSEQPAGFNYWLISTVAPALDSSALKDLSNLLNSVTDWHALGVKLGVKSHELETIQRNYPHDTMRCKHEMLAYCLRGANPPTWRDVRDALCQMGEHESAEKIQKKHLQLTKGTYTCCVLFVVFTCIIFYDAYEWCRILIFSPSELAKCQVLNVKGDCCN